MENMEPVSPVVNNRKVIRISKKKIIITIISIVIFVFIALFALKSMNSMRRYGNSSATIQIPCIESPGIKCPGNNNKRYDSNYYPNTNGSDITDTREFNKLSYKGDIKTRKVKNVMEGVQDAIEIADGRIDNLNISTNYGHAIFVIPKSNLDDFKEDIEKLTHKKLYIETTTSQNLLGQKQSIEEQTENADMSLKDAKIKQQTLTSIHNKKITDLQAELKKVQWEFASKFATYTKTPSNDLKQEVDALSVRENSLQESISRENNNYNAANQNLQNQINALDATLMGLAKQDTKFENNIETVNGYITVRFISYWDMLKIFSPIHPTFLIIILVIIIWLCIRKKSYVPKVQFV